MIDLKDFRVGNWVGRDLKNFPFNIFKVMEIGETMKVGDNTDSSFFDYRDLEPVPLEKKFLESIGFKPMSNGKSTNAWKWMKDDADFYLNVSNGIYCSGFLKELKFVHQLQNAFYYSTGKEINFHP